MISTSRFHSFRDALKIGAALCIGVASAGAAVPNAEKIADAVAETNRLSGRSVPVLLEVALRIGDGSRRKLPGKALDQLGDKGKPGIELVPMPKGARTS